MLVPQLARPREQISKRNFFLENILPRRKPDDDDDDDDDGEEDEEEPHGVDCRLNWS